MGGMPGSVQASWGRARGRRGHVLRTSRILQEHKNHKEHKGKECKRVSSSALALDWLSSGANNARGHGKAGYANCRHGGR